MSLLRGPARFILRLLGWKLLDLPQRPAKAVVIAYPHTSNWDFPLTLLALAALSFDAQWVGKDTMFRGACGPLLRSMGGVAVNRRERTGFVERLAEEFRQREHFHLIMATEGTRGLQTGWKSGFYRMAMAADVPVILAVVDYSKRELGLLSSITLSGNPDADMAHIATCYAGREGYHHRNASPIRLL
ncbi:MAG: 1-acyl-sn-glycerol-3-phosphate acyltransferase [Burkholderiaceae bacterium]|nr:1-acyl-sn-glycerol-3-phosphate acyltransferase [Burkholderiaceae bacterium]